MIAARLIMKTDTFRYTGTKLDRDYKCNPTLGGETSLLPFVYCGEVSIILYYVRLLLYTKFARSSVHHHW